MDYGGCMNKILALLVIAACAIPLVGCVVHGHTHTEVVIESGHIHGDACGHYYYHGGWYIVANHRHYDGCGHVYRSNMWIYDDGGPIHGNTTSANPIPSASQMALHHPASASDGAPGPRWNRNRSTAITAARKAMKAAHTHQSIPTPFVRPRTVSRRSLRPGGPARRADRPC